MRSLRDYIKLVEDGSRDPLGVVARVRALDNEFRATCGNDNPSPFHLNACGRCRSPVWMQPCPVCDFYPYGDMDDGIRIRTPEWEARAEKFREKAHDLYINKMTAAGNIAAWFFIQYRKTVAYKSSPDSETFRHSVEEFIKRVEAETFPSPEEIWNAYKP